jgi:Uma2 family endonuclease
MFPMEGVSSSHARIFLNATRQLAAHLDDRPCELWVGEVRLYIRAFGIYTYPDIMVTCGPIQYADKVEDTFTNPRLIIEVLSPSTMNYDRGEKFRFYRSIPSLSDYLLIAQDSVRVEHYRRQPDNSWLFREFTSPAESVELTSIGCQLDIPPLYHRVQFPATEHSHEAQALPG